MSKQKPQPERITKADLERQIRSLTSDVKSDVMDERQKLVLAGVVGVVVVLLVVFFVGKRSGRRRTTLVEIRRV